MWPLTINLVPAFLSLDNPVNSVFSRPSDSSALSYNRILLVPSMRSFAIEFFSSGRVLSGLSPLLRRHKYSSIFPDSSSPTSFFRIFSSRFVAAFPRCPYFRSSSPFLIRSAPCPCLCDSSLRCRSPQVRITVSFRCRPLP